MTTKLAVTNMAAAGVVAAALGQTDEYVISITHPGFVIQPLQHDWAYAKEDPDLPSLKAMRRESIVCNPCPPRRWKKGSKR